MQGLIRVCDTYLDRFATCQPGQVERLSHELARDLLGQVAACGGTKAAAALFQAHPLHSQVVMQSALMHRALVKPRGYPGDMEMMLMVCDGERRGDTPFARAINDVFVNVPAAQAVRNRVAMMGRALDRLPEGARVLNLAAGPALEVQQLFTDRPDRHLRVDLVDHDPFTVAYLRRQLTRPQVRVLAGNAFRIMAGDLHVTAMDDGNPPMKVSLTGGYDLIYSMGLFDYIPDDKATTPGAAHLTKVLFSLLKPGGTLMVGNYLTPTPASANQAHVRAMLELYSSWYLNYRSPQEIAAFTTKLDTPHHLDLLDDTGHPLQSSADAVIGFAAIQAA